MLQTVEAIVDPSGAVRLLEALHIDHPCRAIVTLIETSPNTSLAPNEPQRGSAATVLNALRTNPLPFAHRRTAAEIDAQILEERNAWD